MSSLEISLPDSLRDAAQELAERDGISLDYFVALAVAERVSSLRTIQYLEERAKRGSRAKFEAALAQVPDVEPEDYDRL